MSDTRADGGTSGAPRRRPSPVPLDQRTPAAPPAPAVSRASNVSQASNGSRSSTGHRAARTKCSKLGMLPALFGTLALLLAVAAGVTYVFAPGFFGKSTSEPDVGAVPKGKVEVANYITSPRMIHIPAIKAEAPIVPVTTVNRELQIPLDPKIAGWWNGGAKPGAAKGTAIIAGHINYAGVTGEFATIGKLKPGNKVYVKGFRAKKSVEVRFTVTGVRTYLKKTLPYKQIFNQNSAGRLAIVTCGGPFDASTGNYEDNIVVFAVPD